MVSARCGPEIALKINKIFLFYRICMQGVPANQARACVHFVKVMSCFTCPMEAPLRVSFFSLHSSFKLHTPCTHVPSPYLRLPGDTGTRFPGVLRSLRNLGDLTDVHLLRSTHTMVFTHSVLKGIFAVYEALVSETEPIFFEFRSIVVPGATNWIHPQNQGSSCWDVGNWTGLHDGPWHARSSQ